MHVDRHRIVISAKSLGHPALYEYCYIAWDLRVSSCKFKLFAKCLLSVLAR